MESSNVTTLIKKDSNKDSSLAAPADGAGQKSFASKRSTVDQDKVTNNL